MIIPISYSALSKISCVGFKTMIVAAKEGAPTNISMSIDTQALDEVVVVAYGTQKARAVTGSMSKMDAETLKDQPVSQIGEKLQG